MGRERFSSIFDAYRRPSGRGEVGREGVGSGEAGDESSSSRSVRSSSDLMEWEEPMDLATKEVWE